MTARSQRAPSRHTFAMGLTSTVAPPERAAELVAAIGALSDRLEVAVDGGERAALEQLCRRFERELSGLLPVAA
jgi:hypothetical protein